MEHEGILRTLEIEDLSDEYLRKNAATNSDLPSFNHVKALQEFGTPKGWKIADRDYAEMFTSLVLGMDAYGHAIRFERVQPGIGASALSVTALGG